MSTGDSSPEPTEPVCVPETKVKTITTEYTTVIPTTILETYTEECEEATTQDESPVAPTGAVPGGEEPEPTAGVPGDVGEGVYPEPSGPAGNET